MSVSIVRTFVRYLGVDDLTRTLSCGVWRWRHPPAQADDSSYLHWAATWLIRQRAGRGGRLASFLGLIIWPFLIPGLALALAVRNGAEVARVTGKSRFRQLRDQIEISVRYAILPPWYYVYDLYQDHNRERILHYINRFEVKRSIYPFLRAYYAHLHGMPAGGSNMLVSDKLRFAARCQQGGLPTSPIVGFAARGELRTPEGALLGALPRVDLFTKPVRGCGGRGATRWEYRNGTFRSNDGRALTESALGHQLEKRSRRVQMLIQPRLRNSPDLADLTPGGLCTVRALTCRDEKGSFELTHAVFRMPVRREAAVDNFHQGGIAAPIDIASGALGRATSFLLTGCAKWHALHPTTGGQIAGRVLPFWLEVVSLVGRAHALFPDLVAVGWDVALLDGGPCLIEANKGPDVDLIQRPHAMPLGTTRFGELLAFHLEAALRAKFGQFAGMPARAGCIQTRGGSPILDQARASTKIMPHAEEASA